MVNRSTLTNVPEMLLRLRHAAPRNEGLISSMRSKLKDFSRTGPYDSDLIKGHHEYPLSVGNHLYRRGPDAVSVGLNRSRRARKASCDDRTDLRCKKSSASMPAKSLPVGCSG